ncbi:MAG: hypothetical protein V3T16_06785 [Gemmatimonadales bacterium]
MGLPERIYTKDELEVARTKGQVIGWIQGVAVVVLGGMVLKLVGWIPALAAVGLVGFIAYKLFSRRKD